MLMGFDPTTAFEYAMPFFDTPTSGIPSQTTQRLFARLDRYGGQQYPSQCRGAFGGGSTSVSMTAQRSTGCMCRVCEVFGALIVTRSHRSWTLARRAGRLMRPGWLGLPFFSRCRGTAIVASPMTDRFSRCAKSLRGSSSMHRS